MKWKRLNSFVDYSLTPIMGSILKNPSKRYMAINFDKSKKPYSGIVREITNRRGDIDQSEHVDRSILHLVESEDGLNCKIISKLNIRGINEIINKFSTRNTKFIGLEDPTIIRDKSDQLHVYFTLAYEIIKKIDGEKYEIFLVHSKGKSLNTLEVSKNPSRSIKEIEFFLDIDSNKHLALVEKTIENKKNYNICLVSSNNLDNWKFEKIIIDPLKQTTLWNNGYVSPSHIFSKKEFDISYLGKNYRLMIINGRGKNSIRGNIKYRKKFRPGLAIFDIEKKEIVWISKKPLFEDPEATKITFASDYLHINPNEGILYAHPNDSFIRAYRLHLDKIKKSLPKKIN